MFWEFGSVRNSTPIEALSFLVALLTFRLTEQGTFTSAHEMKQAFLASSYSCTCHILAAYVALMVWSNHDEDNLAMALRGYLKGLWYPRP